MQKKFKFKQLFRQYNRGDYPAGYHDAGKFS